MGAGRVDHDNIAAVFTCDVNVFAVRPYGDLGESRLVQSSWPNRDVLSHRARRRIDDCDIHSVNEGIWDIGAGSVWSDGDREELAIPG